MLESSKIVNYYFSGSGNTKLLVDHFNAYLISKGFDSSIHEIKKSVEVPDENSVLGLMFPVAMQSTYPFVWDFIHNLPRTDGRQVFMFDTMHAFSGGIVGPLKKVLTKKGYTCIGAKEFTMTSSSNTNPLKVAKGLQKNKKAINEVITFADQLIAGKTSWNRIPIFSDIIRLFSLPRILWALVANVISINDSCVKCNKCITFCPSEAIKIGLSRAQIDKKKCNACMGCLSNCPKQAILLNKKTLQPSNCILGIK